MTDRATAARASADPSRPGERRLGGLIAVAVLSSLLASTCCVLPLALVLVGVTGAWMAHLQALKPLTPYAIALAVGALGWAGWLLFRPVRVCAPGGACATTRPVMRRVFVACAAFIVLLLGFPLIAPLFY